MGAFTGYRLAFSDPAQERAFREDHASRALPFMRAVLVLCAVLYGLFGALDAEVAFSARHELWLIRYGLVCPAILVAALLLGRPRWAPFMEPIVALVVVVAGLSIVAMVVIAPPPGRYLYYTGLVLVLMFSYSVARLRFATASVVGLVVVASYEVVATQLVHTPRMLLVSSNFFFLAANALGMLASFVAEKRERLGFLQVQRIEEDRRTLHRLNATLAELSIRDPLTNLFNRRHLEARLREATALYLHFGRPSAVVLIDLDGFKSVNDMHGHMAGDDVLVSVARTIEATVRGSDLVFRVGGDEFCVLLPDAGIDAAVRVANSVLAALRGARFPALPAGDGLAFSAGCSVLGGSTCGPADLLREADGLLYEAKRMGKGRVVSSSDLPVMPFP